MNIYKKISIMICILFLSFNSFSIEKNESCSSLLDSFISLYQRQDAYELNKKLQKAILESPLNGEVEKRFILVDSLNGIIKDTHYGTRIGFFHTYFGANLELRAHPPKGVKVMGRKGTVRYLRDTYRPDNQEYYNLNIPSEEIFSMFDDLSKNFRKETYYRTFLNYSYWTRGYPTYNNKSFKLNNSKFQYATFSGGFGRFSIIIPTDNGFEVFLVKKEKNRTLLSKYRSLSFKELDMMADVGEFGNKATLNMKLSDQDIVGKERRDLLGVFKHNVDDMWIEGNLIYEDQWPEWFHKYMSKDKDFVDADTSFTIKY